ncbi:hypothetical protein OOT46_18695 [Aquabacterium sp. A7-Y]|uniref:hypothetical protein n=1 Tax=Aquabacterium sp. A7-Y TaxID=1349605 RepID=UPI00223D9B7C|nr:hypothetical protein [Aquabacterium sp. A7-Y]MCW7539867.1 hypothetical protein [Aquabacterium sp. A7-Y]
MTPSPARSGQPTRHLRGRAAATLLVAAPAALHASLATADETRWSGAAGTPYWDSVLNWTAGAPVRSNTRALLGGFDTELRHGSFLAHSVQGSGRLRLSGGELAIGDGGAALGHLDLSGGRLSSSSPVTVQSLRWSGGTLAGSSPRTVRGRAVFTGSGSRSIEGGSTDTPFHLMGETLWEASARSLDSFGRLHVGGGGHFQDRAGTQGPYRRLWAWDLVVEGRYTKTGAATTHLVTAAFENHGRFDVQEGSVTQDLMPGSGGWLNRGTFAVGAGASYAADVPRSTLTHRGHGDVGRGARVELGIGDSSLQSSGSWRIAEGGRLAFRGYEQHTPPFTKVISGSIVNAGTVALNGGTYRIDGGARISGPGWLDIRGGAQVRFDDRRQGASLGGLRLTSTQRFVDDPQSRLQINRPLTLERVDWGDAVLSAAGPVTVRGRAVLHHGAYRNIPSQYGVDDTTVYDKQLTSDFHFQGRVAWGGDADLAGPGRLHIGPGAISPNGASRRPTPPAPRATPWSASAPSTTRAATCVPGPARRPCQAASTTRARCVRWGPGCCAWTARSTTPARSRR